MDQALNEEASNKDYKRLGGINRVLHDGDKIVNAQLTIIIWKTIPILQGRYFAVTEK